MPELLSQNVQTPDRGTLFPEPLGIFRLALLRQVGQPGSRYRSRLVKKTHQALDNVGFIGTENIIGCRLQLIRSAAQLGLDFAFNSFSKVSPASGLKSLELASARLSVWGNPSGPPTGNKTSTWADLAVGLGVVIGRRLSELLGYRTKLEPKSDYSIVFTGQLKYQGVLDGFEIPTLFSL